MPGAGSVRLSRLKAGIHKRLLTLHLPPSSPGDRARLTCLGLEALPPPMAPARRPVLHHAG